MMTYSDSTLMENIYASNISAFFALMSFLSSELNNKPCAIY